MASGKRSAQASRTRARFLVAARDRFAHHGYAGTGTEQLLTDTGTTRGALYHHFKDKAELFAAVCEQMHAEAAAAITARATAAAAGGGSAFAVLLAGCDAWLEFMAAPDVRRILIIEAPTVLGWDRWNELDRRHGYDLLREGIRAAQAERSLPAIPADELAILLNGAMNYAVMMAREPDIAPQIERSKRALHSVLAALQAQAGPQS